MKELSYYFRERGDYRSSCYYRLILPAQTMKDLGLPVKVFWDRGLSELDMNTRLLYMGSADIVLAYQTPQFVGFQKTMRELAPYKDQDGEMQFPPSIVSDTDDDIFNTSPMNPAYQGLGYKRHDGVECQAGDIIWIKDEATGKHIKLWEDGKNINFATNKQVCDALREMYRGSELITCTTSLCADHVRREIGPDAPVHVFPNCIDFEAYPKVDLVQDGETRIMWQGSSAHWEDLWVIRGGIKRVHEKYPHAKWIFWGDVPEWFANVLPSDVVTVLPFIEYAQYKLRLQTINHDINLCPLNTNTFSDVKSAIKFYEAAACTKPAVSLVSDSPVYGEVIDGETGLRYANEDEFVEKLGALIEDSVLRKRLASNAKDWVRANLDPRIHVQKLYEKHVEMRENREKILGPLDPTKRAKKIAKRAAKELTKKRKKT